MSTQPLLANFTINSPCICGTIVGTLGTHLHGGVGQSGCTPAKARKRPRPNEQGARGLDSGLPEQALRPNEHEARWLHTCEGLGLGLRPNEHGARELDSGRLRPAASLSAETEGPIEGLPEGRAPGPADAGDGPMSLAVVARCWALLAP